MTNPVATDFLKNLTTKFGLDPTQQIDMNDPITRLVMAITIVTTEQGEDIYSYDQFVKGCSASAGIDPAIFDSEINPTSLGVENNNSATGANSSGTSGSSSGYVSPALPKIVAGGSSVPTAIISQYAAQGAADIVASPLFQKYIGGIPLSTVNIGSVLGLNSAAAVGPGGVITAASAGVPASFTGGSLSASSQSSIALLQQDVAFQGQLDRFAANNPQIANPQTQIYGLIQGESGFRSTVNSYGYGGYFQMGQAALDKAGFQGTPSQFAQLTPAQQLGVYNDWLTNAGANGKLTDVSLWGAASSTYWQTAPNNTEVYAQGTPAYDANPTWVDRNPNSPTFGKITVGSIKAYYSRNYDAVNAALAGPVSDPVKLGLPTGENYTNQGLTPATSTDEAYTTFKDSKGNEFYRYNDGSVYTTNSSGQDVLVTPPKGVPTTFTQQTVNADGSYTYADPANPDVKYTQSADLKTVKDPLGNIPQGLPGSSQDQSVPPTPGSRSGAIETTPLAVPGTNVTAQQLEIQNSLNRYTTQYQDQQTALATANKNLAEAQTASDALQTNGGSQAERYALSTQLEDAKAAVETAKQDIATTEAKVNDLNQQYQQLPSPGDSSNIPATPTPTDTGTVNPSAITPGSQAQVNAANAAAGGMGAPGC